MGADRPQSSGSGFGIGLVAVLAVLVCCLAPVLVAGGVLVSLGHFLRHPAVVAMGLALMAGTLVAAVGRLRADTACIAEPDRQTTDERTAEP